MVNDERLDLVLYALSDRTRRGILSDVASGNPSVGDLGKPYAMSGPAISKHLKVLERAGLITRIKEGQVNRFRLDPEPLADVVRIVQQLESGRSERDISEAAEPVPIIEELEDYLL